MGRSRARKQGFDRNSGNRESNEYSSAAHLLVSFAKIDFSQPAKGPEDFDTWAT
jgi:hypothetical protein